MNLVRKGRSEKLQEKESRWLLSNLLDLSEKNDVSLWDEEIHRYDRSNILFSPGY
jgi:hypothetical protein